MATHSALLLCFFWLTSPMYGLTNAASTRISQHLGAGRWRAARRACALLYCLAASLAVCIGLLMYLLRHQLGHLLSSDPAVVDMVAELAPTVGGAYTLIGLFYASMATLDGQARPVPVAVAFFLGAFLVSPTLGAALTFGAGCCGDVRLFGLWLGLIAGYVITSILCVIAVCRSDWPQLSASAQKRSERSGGREGGCEAEHTCAAGGECAPPPPGSNDQQPLHAPLAPRE